MTEAELLELMCIWTQSVQGTFGLLLTVLFAYLATAYFVGNRFNNFQAIVVSVLFAFGAGFMLIGLFGAMTRMVYLASQLKQMLPDQMFIASPGIARAFLTLTALSIPVSLFFMYQIRRNPKLGAASSQAGLPAD